MQSPRPGAGHLARMCAVPPTAAEARSDVYSTYSTKATTISRACEYAPGLDVTNLQYFSLPSVSCFLLGCYSLENRRGPQSDPCFNA